MQAFHWFIMIHFCKIKLQKWIITYKSGSFCLQKWIITYKSGSFWLQKWIIFTRHSHWLIQPATIPAILLVQRLALAVSGHWAQKTALGTKNGLGTLLGPNSDWAHSRLHEYDWACQRGYRAQTIFIGHS